jgi:hypothetical protein
VPLSERGPRDPLDKRSILDAERVSEPLSVRVTHKHAHDRPLRARDAARISTRSCGVFPERPETEQGLVA